MDFKFDASLYLCRCAMFSAPPVFLDLVKLCSLLQILFDFNSWYWIFVLNQNLTFCWLVADTRLSGRVTEEVLLGTLVPVPPLVLILGARCFLLCWSGGEGREGGVEGDISPVVVRGMLGDMRIPWEVRISRRRYSCSRCWAMSFCSHLTCSW
jgi:hypothetical protein